LLDHFVTRVSRILTLFEDDNNPFHDFLLPLAVHHRPLMHSLLALSSSHLANTSEQPYHDYELARSRHLDAALRSLQVSLNQGSDSTTAATALVLCLDSICKGDTTGGYKPHLDGARAIIGQMGLDAPSGENEPLHRFLLEFLAYHDAASSVTIINRSATFLEDFALPAFIMQPDTGALLGVLDGLFHLVAKITKLRHEVRKRRSEDKGPAVHCTMLSIAVGIDAEIRDWQPAQPPNTPRHIAAQLYQQCTWIYLYRTVEPSLPSPKISAAVESGLQCMRSLPEQSSTQSILLMPLFLLGCAAFEPNQRPEIRCRFRALHQWSRLGNIIPAHHVVEKIWQLMDNGDEDLSWDWERIIQQMGYDFLVT